MTYPQLICIWKNELFFLHGPMLLMPGASPPIGVLHQQEQTCAHGYH